LWITLSVFVFVYVTIASAIAAPVISQHIALNILQLLSIQEAKAIEHNTSHGQDSNEGSTIPSSSSSSSCISYNLLARVITISRSSTDLTDIHDKLDHDSILSKQSDEVDNNVWLLNVSLVISKGAAFHIDSTDTKWNTIWNKGAWQFKD
jgi:hypothetical protein